MNPAIVNFVCFTTSTVQKMLNTMPDYDNVPQNYDGASKLVSKEAQEKRATKALLGIEIELENLYVYLESGTTTQDEKIFLLKNLGNYLNKLPESQFKRYKFNALFYEDDNAYDNNIYDLRTYSVKFPQGETKENSELNALSSVALLQLERFNAKQLMLFAPKITSAAHGKLVTSPAREEPIVSAPPQPTFFDFLIAMMLSVSVELAPKYYSGLSQLKTLESFVSTMINNVEQFVTVAGDPQSLRNTIAYKILAIPRTRYCFFGTHSQNLLDSIITKEIKRRRRQILPVATAVTGVQDSPKSGVKAENSWINEAKPL